jgi:hypothetical protein
MKGGTSRSKVLLNCGLILSCVSFLFYSGSASIISRVLPNIAMVIEVQELLSFQTSFKCQLDLYKPFSSWMAFSIVKTPIYVRTSSRREGEHLLITDIISIRLAPGAALHGRCPTDLLSGTFDLRLVYTKIARMGTSRLGGTQTITTAIELLNLLGMEWRRLVKKFAIEPDLLPTRKPGCVATKTTWSSSWTDQRLKASLKR